MNQIKMILLVSKFKFLFRLSFSHNFEEEYIDYSNVLE